MTGDEYVLYGADFSLFTRKLQAALRFYGAEFRQERKQPRDADEIERRAGTHQVPVLQTPENWLIADTTPILDLLDGRFPERRLFPEGALGVLVHVAEEILDEWFARVMVHFRWHYDENTRHLVAEILGREVSVAEAREHPLAQWGPRACRATGTESPHQQKQAEQEYFALLDALERELGTTRYALGDRPTAVDTILLGGLRAHTNADPVPDLSRFARVVAWDAREADRWDGDGELAPFPDSTPFVAHLLEVGGACYAPFVLANAAALERGDKAFRIETYGEETSYLTRPYPEQSRRLIRARIANRLSDADRRRVVEFLDARGLGCFAP
ncbi:MAG: glutathione S-transferase family protein [Myxococcota bacterium]